MRRTVFILLLLLISGALPAFNLAFDAAFEKKEPVLDVEKDLVPINGEVWLAKTEVSNEQYKRFLLGLIENNRASEVPRMAPDMSLWEKDLTFNDPYALQYFKHPAFDQYPVVGISHQAAQAYCEWLTSEYGMTLAREAFGPEVNFRLKFRLPTEEEWRLAAGEGKWDEAFFAGGYAYPRDHKGRFLFNHKLGPGDYAGTLGGHYKDYEGYMITGPVRSFMESEQGFFNMAGNVAEMVAERGTAKGGSWFHLADECRIGAQLPYSRPQVWLGFRIAAEKDYLASPEEASVAPGVE